MEYICEKCTKNGQTPICSCGIGVGQMQMRQGILCTVDTRGRLYLRAGRKADVLLARRVAAAMQGAGDDVTRQLLANITGIRENS